MDIANKNIHKRQMLEKKLAQLAKAKKQSSRIPIRKNGERIKLSSAQERMLFMNLMSPESNAYRIPEAYKLTGSLDLERFEQSLNKIIERHEILRTQFTQVEEGPYQVVKPFQKKDLSVTELYHLPLNQRVQEAEKAILHKTNKTFELLDVDLWEYELIEIKEDVHVFYINFHHSIADGWSLGVFWNELCDFYNNGLVNEALELPIQYGDYSNWERSDENEIQVRKHLAYWREELKDSSPTKLPSDIEPSNDFSDGISCLEVPFELQQKIEEECKKYNVTPYTYLFAVYNILLYKYSHSLDIIVGTPVSGRDVSEVQNLIGLFVNTLAIRMEIKEDETFDHHLFKLKEKILKGMDHQGVPFNRVVKELKPTRDISEHPFFQTTFTYQSSVKESLTLNGIAKESLELTNDGSKFDFSFFVLKENEQHMKILSEYKTFLYNKSTIEQFMNQYIHLIETIIHNPHVPVRSLSILSKKEQQIIDKNTKNQWSIPAFQSIPKLFEYQTQLHPNDISVREHDQSYSYKEINKQSDALANHLLQLGIESEEFVGVYLKRSKDMIVSILGIMKAGAAYVPLDPAYPEDRLKYMVQKSNIRYVISQAGQHEEWSNVESISINSIGRCNQAVEPVSIRPNQAAYMIFTSGSTGKPKGVVIEHSSLINLVFAQNKMLDIKPEDRIIQFASMSFDASMWEIFMALGNGATLCLLPDDFRNLDRDIIELLNLYEITIGTFPPSFLMNIHPNDLPSLEKVVVAGEKCPVSLAEKWSTSKRFWNAYGPSETTVCATAYEFLGGDKIPIGKPIANTEVYVFDSNFNQVPIGVPGELYIGGDGLARGYCNDREKTEAAFHFVHTTSGKKRLYKTGDLVMFNQLGELEFIDRVDQQVKINGHRVELGEIENCLMQMKEIVQAVVLFEKNQNKLYAYYVANAGTEVDHTAIIQTLKKQLPIYMIPSALHRIDSVPLTPNGKVDKKQLSLTRISSEKTVPPISQVEEATSKQIMIMNIMSQILNKEVGPTDNFFDHGGDSLLILKVINKLREQGYVVTPRNFYKFPTPVSLSNHVKESEDKVLSTPILTGEFELSPIQKWFFQQNITDEHHWNFSLSFDISYDLSMEDLRQVIRRLLMQHDALRLAFPRVDGKRTTQEYKAVDDIPIIFHSISEEDQFTQVVQNLEEYYQSTLNLENYVFKSVYITDRNGSHSNRLMLIIHHLVTDWLSGSVLEEDLRKLLKLQRNGASIELPPKATSFEEWVRQLHTYSRSETLIDERSGWQEITNEIRFQPKLPVDWNGANLRNSTSRVEIVLDESTTASLLKNSKEEFSATMEAVLLASLVKVLNKWTKNNQVAIHMDSHGREDLFDDVEISRTIGWFTNIYPLLVEVKPDFTVKETVARVKENMNLMRNNGLGYGVLHYLTDLLGPHDPTPEILFNFFGQDYQQKSEDSVDDGVKSVPQCTGSLNSPKQERLHTFEILGAVREGRLCLAWQYSSNLHKRETIEKLTQSLKSNLIQISNKTSTLV